MKLNIFFTAGFSQKLNTLDIIKILAESGVDKVEVGMPYSDPLVDGPVIQEANQEALKNGMSIPTLFEELKDLKKTVKIPVVLMGYLNPVLQFGIEKFCQKANEVGIDGVILPDLPPKMYERDYKELFEKHNLKMTFIITPQTQNDRIQYLDSLSEGFVYAVADSSITGSDLNHKSREDYFKRLKEFSFLNECFVGFGIKTKDDLNYLSQFVDGGVIGTAFIKTLNKSGDVSENIKDFIASLR